MTKENTIHLYMRQYAKAHILQTIVISMALTSLWGCQRQDANMEGVDNTLQHNVQTTEQSMGSNEPTVEEVAIIVNEVNIEEALTEKLRSIIAALPLQEASPYKNVLSRALVVGTAAILFVTLPATLYYEDPMGVFRKYEVAKWAYWGVGGPFLATTAGGVGYCLRKELKEAWYGHPLQNSKLRKLQDETVDSYRSVQEKLKNIYEDIDQYVILSLLDYTARENLKQFFCEASRLLRYLIKNERSAITDILINEIQDLEKLCVSYEKLATKDTRHKMILNDCLLYLREILCSMPKYQPAKRMKPIIMDV